jgi:hypothetical protein
MALTAPLALMGLLEPLALLVQQVLLDPKESHIHQLPNQSPV